jgi:hypothetical protein
MGALKEENQRESELQCNGTQAVGLTPRKGRLIMNAGSDIGDEYGRRADVGYCFMSDLRYRSASVKQKS